MSADRIGAGGRVTPDPTANMPDGSSIRIFERLIAPDVPAGTAAVENWDYFKGSLLMMAFTDHERHYIEGSAVMVAPGVALCANHVMEPRIQQLIGGQAHPSCHGINEHGLMIWNIRKYLHAPGSDLGIVSLELASDLPPDNAFYQVPISTRLPKIGEDLLICGFRADKAEFP